MTWKTVTVERVLRTRAGERVIERREVSAQGGRYCYWQVQWNRPGMPMLRIDVNRKTGVLARCAQPPVGQGFWRLDRASREELAPKGRHANKRRWER